MMIRLLVLCIAVQAHLRVDVAAVNLTAQAGSSLLLLDGHRAGRAGVVIDALSNASTTGEAPAAPPASVSDLLHRALIGGQAYAVPPEAVYSPGGFPNLRIGGREEHSVISDVGNSDGGFHRITPMTYASGSLSACHASEMAITASNRGTRIKHTRLYIAVLSSPQNVERRDAIRKSWKLDADRYPLSFKVEFVVCSETGDDAVKAHLKNMEEEIVKYQDIARLNCFEGYKEGNLTRKVLASMRHFVQSDDGSMTAFMKTDDDALVRINRVLELVQRSANSADNFYIGIGMRQPLQAPRRAASDKNYEPCYTFKGHKFPKTALGAGYIVNQELVRRWVQTDVADIRKSMLWNEDRAVAVWVDYEIKTNHLHVMYVNMPGSNDANDGSRHSLDRNSFLFHRLSSGQIQCVWKGLKLWNYDLRSCLKGR